MWKRILGLSMAVVLFASVPAVADHGGHTVQVKRNPDNSLKRHARNTVATSNWSGWAIPNYQTGQLYPSAIGTWIVPTVTYGVNNLGTGAEYQSAWVGIGGSCLNSSCSSVASDLIQLGTDGEVTSTGSTLYYAWYEMLPAGSIQIPHPIQPGDVITASLTCNTSCTTPNVSQSWTLAMTDATAGWNWSLNVTYSSSLSSAEWITEAPYLGSVLPLPNFTTETYAFQSPIGTVPPLTSTGSFVMENPGGGWSNTSPLSGTNFSNCYGVGTFVACNPGSLTLGTIGSGGSGGPAPIVSIGASPTSISLGGTSTIAYSSQNASSCTGTGFTASGTQGSAVVAPTITTKYTLTCTGSGGTGSGSTTVTVKTTKVKGHH